MNFGDLPSCYTSENRKARKQHKCCECLGFIEPGERYEYFSGVWSGEPDTFKTCSDCAALRAEVADEDLGSDGPPAFGTLFDDIEDVEHMVRSVEIMRKRNSPMLKQFESRLKEEE